MTAVTAPAQRDMLAAMHRLHRQGRGWLSLGMLVDATGSGRNTATHTLAALVASGHARRGRGSGQVIYRLTEQGADAAEALAGPPATDAQIRELAGTMAAQLQAIADGTLTGPRHAALRLVASNMDRLLAWVPDDRQPDSRCIDHSMTGPDHDSCRHAAAGGAR
jgi:hypothetical protein